MLCLSGNYVSEETTSNIINFILSASELNTYSIHKLFLAGRSYGDEEGLIKVAVYILGEIGDRLISQSAITEDNVSISYSEVDIVNWLQSILRKGKCAEYVLNSLLKLSIKLGNIDINSIILNEIKASNYEVQQRAVEYKLFKNIVPDDMKREVLAPVPLPKGLEIIKK
jgi:hypothetical protein